jgi:hypothetical protein
MSETSADPCVSLTAAKTAAAIGTPQPNVFHRFGNKIQMTSPATSAVAIMPWMVSRKLNTPAPWV